jgi:hypothetical protein
MPDSPADEKRKQDGYTRDAITDAFSKAESIGAGQPLWKERAQQAFEGGLGMLLGAFGIHPYGETTASNLGELVSAGLPLLGAIKASQAAKVAKAVPKGIRAYHGSPHAFERFDPSKIGMGEGAASYGHGLYFAEAEPTAKAYREALKPGRGGTPADTAARILNAVGGDREKAIGEINRRLEALGKIPPEHRVPGPLMEARTVLESGQPLSGHMYEVNIKADPEHFLDWDRSLSEQPELLEKIRQDFPPELKDPGGYTGGQAYRAMRELPEDAAWLLQQRGIPGIRYLDQLSRAAGEGSRNYVVFPESTSLVDILRKYGLIGAAGAGALGQQLGAHQER